MHRNISESNENQNNKINNILFGTPKISLTYYRYHNMKVPFHTDTILNIYLHYALQTDFPMKPLFPQDNSEILKD